MPLPELFNSLCEVFVPTDEDLDGWGEIATGFPISENRVITCAHVLDKLHAARRPEIRWHLLDDKYHVVGDDYLVFDGRAHDVDAAILEVDFPDGVSIATPFPSCPLIGSETRSMGFPEAGEKNGEREQISIDGKLNSYADQQAQFTIGVESPPGKKQSWKGASGSPVFVDEKLIGVYIASPTPFNLRRIHATPIYQLLKIKGFRDAIGFDVQHPGFLPLQKQAVAVLNGHPDLAAAMVGAIGLELDEAGNEQTTADQVFSTLISTDASQFLGYFLESLQQLNRRTDRTHQALEGLAYLLLPLVYRREDVTNFFQSMRGGDRPTVVTAPKSLTLVEAMMAGVDGQPMSISCQPDAASERIWLNYDPPGDHLLHPPPDTGIDRGGQRQVMDFQSGLIARFMVGDESDAKRRLSSKFLDGSDLKITKDDKQAIRAQLDDMINYQKRHCYLVYESDSQQPVPQFITWLSGEFPQIICVGLPKKKLNASDRNVRTRLNYIRFRKVVD